MKTKRFAAILAVMTLATTFDVAQAQEVQVKRENGIYYLEVKGTPYECGVQHGEALKSEIQKSVSDYKANVAKMFGEENAVKILDWALNKA